MSAFTVSPETIDLIISYANQHVGDIYIKTEDGSIRYDFKDKKVCQEVAQILMDENNRSVNYRYREQSQAIKINLKLSFVGPAKVISVIKCCDCLEYQSCETDNYEETLAYKFLQVIRKDAVKKILNRNGYEDAPWGL